jgi:uncharacterized lipoprotein YmbA
MRGPMLMKSVSIALLLLLTACSGQPVPTQYYLMRSDNVPESRAVAPSENYALGMVAIASYIDQPGMVLEMEGGQIRPALHHKWAEPMSRSVRSFLQAEISEQLGETLFPVDVSPAEILVEIKVDQLHGTRDGKALLSAYWWLKRDGVILESYQVGESIALKSDGYAALAEAEKALLRLMAGDIANTLKARAAK